MTPLELTYLTVDSIQLGVGASQVLPYVERMAAMGVRPTLHSFEPLPVNPATVERVAAVPALSWHPHAFGREGGVGGLHRVVAAGTAIRSADLVHARSDLSAAAALLAHPKRWLWDIRSFWIDQRIALDMTKRGSTAERALRRIESASARRCDAITTLTSSAIPELARRHGTAVADKATVVTTCVDLDRFTHSPMPDLPLRLLLSGTFNPLYDVDTMLRFAQHVRDARPESSMTLLRPGQSRLDRAVQDAGGVVSTSGFSEMPAQVASHHAGLSICRSDEPTAIIAAMPTKIGEFLACGRPVVANAGLGDVEALLGNSGAGVVLHGTSDRELSGAAHQLIELIDDRATPARCRRVAEENFDLDVAVRTLVSIYSRLE